MFSNWSTQPPAIVDIMERTPSACWHLAHEGLLPDAIISLAGKRQPCFASFLVFSFSGPQEGILSSFSTWIRPTLSRRDAPQSFKQEVRLWMPKSFTKVSETLGLQFCPQVHGTKTHPWKEIHQFINDTGEISRLVIWIKKWSTICGRLFLGIRSTISFGEFIHYSICSYRCIGLFADTKSEDWSEKDFY